VTASLQRAVSQGKKLGRLTKMNDGMKSAVKLLREKAMVIKQIAKQLQIRWEPHIQRFRRKVKGIVPILAIKSHTKEK
jgi:hypothetical protein